MVETVLVTGVTGFIAKEVTRRLLAQGYRVRGTLRAMSRADEVRRLVGANEDALELVEADLTSDRGWREALQGCAYVQHIASAFPLSQPRDREALVDVARGGTLRVIDHALDAGVRRIVLTSSIVAMMYRSGWGPGFRITEADWSDPDWRPATAYIVSKTRAERAAWERVRARGRERDLVTINPGLVLGPVPDGDLSTSVALIEQMLDGKLPALPPIGFAAVDVRDVANLHVAAMTAPDAGGHRLIASGGAVTLADLARALRADLGSKAAKVPTRVLPLWIARLLPLLNADARALAGDLAISAETGGSLPEADTRYVTDLTGVVFKSPREAIAAAGQSLVAVQGR
jgi:dihydroflavonol-4-reductase